MRPGHRRPHLLTPLDSGRDLRQLLLTDSREPCPIPFSLPASCCRSHSSTLLTPTARQSRIPPSCSAESKQKTPDVSSQVNFPFLRGEPWHAMTPPCLLLPVSNMPLRGSQPPRHRDRIQTWVSPTTQTCVPNAMSSCLLLITSSVHKLQPAERNQNARQ